jgi:hypothetical protein
MKKILKIIFLCFFCYFLIDFLVPYIGFLQKRSIDNQINYLEIEFNKHLSEKMQNEYPEGEIFSNVIFALSLIEYSKFNKKITASKIENVFLRTLSDKVRSNFHENLPLKFGAFYNGWLNYTLKKYLESNIFSKSTRKDYFYDLYSEFSERIKMVQKDSIQPLETYPGSFWPADNLVCIASLNQKNHNLQLKWLDKIKNYSKDSLIHHYNSEIHNIRGSSQAMINFFLEEIDTSYFKLSYMQYSERFKERLFGISFVKEFESGKGTEDIDSGPILFGFGSVATIMNNILEGKINNSDSNFTFGFLNTIGLPINIFGKKYYLFKKQQMFDIFMLWNSINHLHPKKT